MFKRKDDTTDWVFASYPKTRKIVDKSGKTGFQVTASHCTPVCAKVADLSGIDLWPHSQRFQYLYDE